jgi:hypothetical protein
VFLDRNRAFDHEQALTQKRDAGLSGLGLRYPDAGVQAAAAELEQRTLAQLIQADLRATGRRFAYAYGAGEAMLLEACGSQWRADYPQTLALGDLLKDAAAHWNTL